MARWPLAHPLSIGTIARRRLGVVGPRPARRRGPPRASPSTNRSTRLAARTRSGRGDACERRPVAARPPGRGRVVGRPVRLRPPPAGSDLVDRVQRARTGSPRAGGTTTSTARPTAATSACSPVSAASRRVQYGPGDARLAHGPARVRADQPRSSPPPGRSRCSPSTCAASPDGASASGRFGPGEERLDHAAESLGFLSRWEVGAVLEHDRFGTPDPRHERLHDGGRHLVEAS